MQMTDEIVDRVVESLARRLESTFSIDMEKYRANTVVGRTVELVVFIHNTTGAQIICRDIEISIDPAGYVAGFEIKVTQ